MSFGEKLKLVRKDRNITQEALAELLNVSRQAISKWESDNGYPETEKLLLISKTLNISIDYLMNDKNKVEAIKDIIKITGNKQDDCQNIIYIGDGFTDYYAMEYVKRNGGTTIFVYRNKNNQDLKRLKDENVISFSTYADFSCDSQLSKFIKNILKKEVK